jgi:hypothetical protein
MPMRPLKLRYLAAVLLLSSICWAGGLDTPARGLASVHPLWLPGEPHPFDKRLLGKWSTYFVSDMGIMSVPIPVRLQVTGTRKTGAYQLTFSSLEKPDDLPPIIMRGFLVQSEGQLFLDLTRVGETAALHRVFLVVFGKGIPRLVRWNLPIGAKAIAESIGVNGDNDVATADTEHLRQFVAEHVKDKEIFPSTGQSCGQFACLDFSGVFPLFPPSYVPKIVPRPAEGSVSLPDGNL